MKMIYFNKLMIKRSVEKPDPVSLQKMLKYANFEDWYPSGKFQLFDIFLVSEGSLGPKPPTYPAPAIFFYFKVPGCFGPFMTLIHGPRIRMYYGSTTTSDSELFKCGVDNRLGPELALIKLSTHVGLFLP